MPEAGSSWLGAGWSHLPGATGSGEVGIFGGGGGPETLHFSQLPGNADASGRGHSSLCGKQSQLQRGPGIGRNPALPSRLTGTKCLPVGLQPEPLGCCLALGAHGRLTLGPGVSCPPLVIMA